MNSNSTKEQTLKIWIVSDGKPGHQNQSEGLIQSLDNHRHVEVSRIPPVSTSKALEMLILKKSGNLHEIHRQIAPDLIIGTGHQTHLSLLAYRRCFGGKVVIMMSPSLFAGLFDLCFIPRHDKPPKRKNIIETFGAINRVIPGGSRRNVNIGLILLGGLSKHYNWDPAKVISQMEQLFYLYSNIKWSIVGSRRTPIDMYKQIKEHFPQVEIIQPESVSSDWLPAKIIEAGHIWVTADSISMIYEALTSGAKTGVLKLDFGKSTRITEEIDRLQSENKVTTVDSISNEDSARNTKPFPPIYEADRCGKLLLEKFDL